MGEDNTLFIKKKKSREKAESSKTLSKDARRGQGSSQKKKRT